MVAGTKRCRGTRSIAASTRSSSAALPSSSLMRSAWIAITSTMCRRKMARCFSFIGFMTGRSCTYKTECEGAFIPALSATWACASRAERRSTGAQEQGRWASRARRWLQTIARGKTHQYAPDATMR